MRFFAYHCSPERSVDFEVNAGTYEEAAEAFYHFRRAFGEETKEIFVSMQPIPFSGRLVKAFGFSDDGVRGCSRDCIDECNCKQLTSLNLHYVMLTGHNENCSFATPDIRTKEAASRILPLLRMMKRQDSYLEEHEKTNLLTLLTICSSIMEESEYDEMKRWIEG